MTVDLAIFGSGFAAFEVAREAARRGRRIVILERGGDDLARADPRLSRVPSLREPVRSGGFDFGVDVPAAFEGVPRYIGLGGTSELWSGKWRRLDAVDFGRPYEDRRWPIGVDDLTPWYDRIAADYGWPDWSGDRSFAPFRTLAAAHGLRLVDIYEEVPPLRLRDRWNALVREGRVEILCGARIERVTFDDAADRLRVLNAIDEDGAHHAIEAGAVVVAAGGIESIHVSHALRAARGASAPLPERYAGFADHPKAFVGTIGPAHHADLVTYLKDALTTRRRLIAFGLPEDELLQSALGNHTVFLVPPDPGGAAGPWRVMISLEQFAEPGNFIATHPTPAVSWHVSPGTIADAEAFLARALPRLASLVGPITRDANPVFRGASHHLGALPMGNPGESYVNADCRFHDIANLYCASSAVFPTSGSANPTMTILALARRLASHLTEPSPRVETRID